MSIANYPAIEHPHTLKALPVRHGPRHSLVPLSSRQIVFPGPTIHTSKNPESISIKHIDEGLNHIPLSGQYGLLNRPTDSIARDCHWCVPVQLVHYEVISS